MGFSLAMFDSQGVTALATDPDPQIPDLTERIVKQRIGLTAATRQHVTAKVGTRKMVQTNLHHETNSTFRVNPPVSSNMAIENPLGF